MLDIRFIRNNQEKVQINADRKNYKVSISDLISLDDKCRSLQSEIDGLRSKRNSLNKSLNGAKPTPETIEQSKLLKNEVAEKEEAYKSVYAQFIDAIKKVPNMVLESVPIGTSEDDNQVAKVVGEPTKFDFTPKNHYEIALNRDWIDKERAAKITGSRFAYVKGDLVKLQMAIVQFVINELTDEYNIQKIAEEAGIDGISTKPFVPVLPPLMLRTDTYDAMDRLEPRDDRYKIEGDDLWLEGSAEHVLGSMHSNEILDQSETPLRYLGYATSFRREAGTYGKDMEGIFRMHQFDKMEMESFTTGEDGYKEHLLFVAIQEHLIKKLELPYRVIEKCTADIGKPDARGIDMEVWLPGQDKYRETHTADYMTDYQSRRLNTRVRLNNGEVELACTNDATAFALGRIMIAVLENKQKEDGTIEVPTALRQYLNGKDVL
jgi:seryl-tRNA synthetase